MAVYAIVSVFKILKILFVKENYERKLESNFAGNCTSASYIFMPVNFFTIQAPSSFKVLTDPSYLNSVYKATLVVWGPIKIFRNLK